MRIFGMKPHHARGVQTYTKFFNQSGKVFGKIRTPIKIRFMRIEYFRNRHREADDIEAKTGIKRISKRIKPITKEPHHAFRITQRARGFNTQSTHRAISTKEREFESPSALPLFFKHARKISGECEDRAMNIMFMADGFGKATLGDKGRNETTRRNRRFNNTAHAIKARQKIATKTGSQRRARSRGKIINGFQTETRERNHIT